MREGKLHPDTKKHLLLFDIIYCCHTYDLFEIILLAKPICWVFRKHWIMRQKHLSHIRSICRNRLHQPQKNHPKKTISGRWHLVNPSEAPDEPSTTTP
jgi:hypothetical protein